MANLEHDMDQPIANSLNSKYCKNPKTNRYIVIGGRTWRRLMKEGIIASGGYKDPNVLYEIPSDNEQSVSERKQHLIKEKARIAKTSPMRPGYNLAMSKNKAIVYQRSKMTNEESSRSTADACLEVVDAIQNNEIEIPEDMSRKQARDYLQGLIFNQMLSKGNKFKNVQLEKLGRKKVVKKVKFAPVHKVRSIQDYMPSRKPTKSKKPIVVKKSKATPKAKKEPVYYLPDDEEIEEEEEEEEIYEEYEEEEEIYEED